MRTARELKDLGYPMPHRKPVQAATAWKVTRYDSKGRPLVVKDSFTTHLRGPSVARPTSGIGHLPTRAWMDVNAERYGIVRHRGSI